MNTKSLLTKIVMPIAMAVGVSGCGDISQDFTKRTNYNGYDAIIYIDGNERKIVLSPKDDYDVTRFLMGEDENNDGRFDTIRLNRLPKGHQLEQYANIQSLEKAYDEVKGATQ